MQRRPPAVLQSAVEHALSLLGGGQLATCQNRRKREAEAAYVATCAQWGPCNLQQEACNTLKRQAAGAWLPGQMQ